MNTDFNRGYNEGLNTAIRRVVQLSDDLLDFGDTTDAVFLLEISEGLKELLLEIEE